MFLMWLLRVSCVLMRWLAVCVAGVCGNCCCWQFVNWLPSLPSSWLCCRRLLFLVVVMCVVVCGLPCLQFVLCFHDHNVGVVRRTIGVFAVFCAICVISWRSLC